MTLAHWGGKCGWGCSVAGAAGGKCGMGVKWGKGDKCGWGCGVASVAWSANVAGAASVVLRGSCGKGGKCDKCVMK